LVGKSCHLDCWRFRLPRTDCVATPQVAKPACPDVSIPPTRQVPPFLHHPVAGHVTALWTQDDAERPPEALSVLVVGCVVVRPCHGLSERLYGLNACNQHGYKLNGNVVCSSTATIRYFGHPACMRVSCWWLQFTLPLQRCLRPETYFSQTLALLWHSHSVL
jgi:hypothetical protein